MTFGRYLALVLTLYIGADLLNPLTPGVFSFDNDTLFMDGTVQFKSEATSPVAPEEPALPLLGMTDMVGSLRVASQSVLVAPAPVSRMRRTHLRRDLSASLAPPPAPEDH